MTSPRKQGKRAAKKPAARKRAKAPAGKGRAGSRRLLRHLLRWSLVLFIWSVLASGGVIAYHAWNLPDIGQAEGIQRAPSIILLASDGSEIASYGGIYGQAVDLASLPPHLPQAVIAVEDRRFYSHLGVDPRGLARALWQNLKAGHVVQGGSTITQQLAKNLFLNPDRTISRKVQEALLALWLEQRFSKDQILTIYLNRVYLGAGAYGVDAAARRYFGKPASRVSLAEAALLAGLLKAPSRLNPLSSVDRAEARTALVLGAMAEAGFISTAERQAAEAAGSTVRPRRSGGAPYFADWIMAQLRGAMGEVNRDLRVFTTLDPKIQAAARSEMTRTLAEAGQQRAVGQGAAILLDRSGAVLGMVGGRDYGESQFNRATQALRQPGSAFKPFVYLMALEEGIAGPDSRVEDAPVEIAGWRPNNFGGRYYGKVTLRESLARSLNSVAVRLLQQGGPTAVIERARRLGITTDLKAEGPLALGASEVTLIELTGAYAAFASGGVGVWPYGIREIRSADGDIFFRRLEGSGPGRVITPKVAAQMDDLLSAVVATGSGRRADPGRPAAGKTGTSQSFRDALFVGYAGDLIAGVWFGNDDASPMAGVTGGSLPAETWRRVMVRALRGRAEVPLQVVAEVETPEAEGSEEAEGGFFERLLVQLKEEADAPAEEGAKAERLQRMLQSGRPRK